MPTSRYVTLVPVRHNGIDFPAGTPIALSDEYANPLKLTGAIAPQAGALPSMPTVPGAVLREQLDSGTGSTNKRYLEIATSPDGRVRFPLNADLFPRSAISATLKAAFVGDSTGEARNPNFKWVKGHTGYYKKTEWSSTGPAPGSLTTLNISGYAALFVDTIRANSACIKSDAFTMEFDGVGKMRVSVGGEDVGQWLDITGGGWFEALSGGGQKGILFSIKWRMRPPGAASGSGTLPSTLTFERSVTGLASPYFSALARLGYADHDFYCQGITSDTIADIRARNHMMVALAPQVAAFHCGVNSFQTNDIADVVAIVRELNAVGTFVVWTTFIPYTGLTTQARAQQYVAFNNAVLRLPKLYPELGLMVIDGASPFINSRVAYGAGVVTATDFVGDGLHPTFASISNKFAPVAFEALSKLLPKQRVRVMTAMDTYDATNNPTGNRAGTAGAFIGAAGTLGATPTPSGAVPTSWVDSTATPANPFTSVVYTEPDNASAIPRDDAPGNWFRAQFNSATVGNADRMLKLTLANTFAAGQKYRLHLTCRLKNTSWLRIFQVGLTFVSSSGRTRNTFAMPNAGIVPTIAGGVIADSGTMYLSSDEIAVPDDFSGNAYVTVWVINGLGGSTDLYLADCIVEQVS